MAGYMTNRVTKGTAEAIDGIIQSLKRKPCGFEAVERMVAMIYLVASRLAFVLLKPMPATRTNSN